MSERIVNSEFYILLTKVLIPSFLTITSGIFIEVKNGIMKVSVFNVAMSYVVGMTGAYISSEIVFENLKGGQASLAIAFITLLSKSIGTFILTKLPIDYFLIAIFEGLFDYLSNIFKVKK